MTALHFTPNHSTRKTPFPLLVGRNILALRQRRGLQQRDLAARAGLLPDRLSKYERGTDQPTLFALWRIAQSLHYPLELLLPEVELEGHDQRFYLSYRRVWMQPAQDRRLAADLLEALLSQPPSTRDLGETQHASRP